MLEIVLPIEASQSVAAFPYVTRPERVSVRAADCCRVAGASVCFRAIPTVANQPELRREGVTKIRLGLCRWVAG